MQRQTQCLPLPGAPSGSNELSSADASVSNLRTASPVHCKLDSWATEQLLSRSPSVMLNVIDAAAVLPKLRPLRMPASVSLHALSSASPTHSQHHIPVLQALPRHLRSAFVSDDDDNAPITATPKGPVLSARLHSEASTPSTSSQHACVCLNVEQCAGSMLTCFGAASEGMSDDGTEWTFLEVHHFVADVGGRQCGAALAATIEELVCQALMMPSGGPQAPLL